MPNPTPSNNTIDAPSRAVAFLLGSASRGQFLIAKAHAPQPLPGVILAYQQLAAKGASPWLRSAQAELSERLGDPEDDFPISWPLLQDRRVSHAKIL